VLGVALVLGNSLLHILRPSDPGIQVIKGILQPGLIDSASFLSNSFPFSRLMENHITAISMVRKVPGLEVGKCDSEF
jgi:hypothetical protein